VSLKLPPLPPVGGETTGRSVVDVIAEQHAELLALCERLGAGGVAEQQRVAQVVVAALSRHLSGEQQYLYPAVRRVVPGGEALADRELAADHDLLVLLKRWAGGRPGGPEFRALTAGVVAAVRRHVAADAEELLPVLTQMAPIEDLIRIGNRLETAQEAAPTRPHPATPSAPPWNKVVDPVIALADKARDAVSRRVTYPRDL
jgi:hypothetical protein